MTFGADGTFVTSAIGATDVAQVGQGRWRLLDPATGRVRIDIQGRSEVLTVASLTADRLAITVEKS